MNKTLAICLLAIGALSGWALKAAWDTSDAVNGATGVGSRVTRLEAFRETDLTRDGLMWEAIERAVEAGKIADLQERIGRIEVALEFIRDMIP